MAATQQAVKKDLAVHEPTVSERFTAMVVKEFSSTMGDMTKFSEEQRRLAQHLYVKIDASLNALEAKRQKSDKAGTPIIWQNINMQKLALDAVHRIELGLDALIPNHIHPIPYMNGKTGKYDLDLRIGYVGKDLYRRKVALEEPIDIRYELVYSTDTFVAKKRDFQNKVESYEFVINNPFDRGDILGGFGYIVYKEESKNKLVLVTAKDFKKSENAGNKDFWSKHPTEMKYKTLVTRVTDKLTIDPKKVTTSYAMVEEQEAIIEAEAEIAQNANQEIIDTTADPAGDPDGTPQDPEAPPPMTAEEIAEITAKEQAEAAGQATTRGPGF